MKSPDRGRISYSIFRCFHFIQFENVAHTLILILQRAKNAEEEDN